MSCGSEDAEWLVTWPYDPEQSRAGGVLLYGERCRREKRQQLLLTVPLRLIRLDAERLMLELYSGGFTETDVEIVADMVGLPEAWVHTARQALERSQKSS